MRGGREGGETDLATEVDWEEAFLEREEFEGWEGPVGEFCVYEALVRLLLVVVPLVVMGGRLRVRGEGGREGLLGRVLCRGGCRRRGGGRGGGWLLL